MTTIETGRATDLDRLCVDTIRMLAIDAVEQAKSGHPGTPMALAPDRLRPLHAHHAPLPRAPGLAQPRSLRPQRRPRVDAPLRAAVPDRLRTDARGHQALPPARIAVRRASRIRAGARHRGDDRPPRPGPGRRRRPGAGRADAQRPPGRRRHRPPHLRHRLRRRHAGGHRVRGRVAGRSPRALALVVFYDDNHITIEGDTSLAFSESRPSATRPTAGTSCTSAKTSTCRGSRARRGEAMDVDDRPSLIVCRTHIAQGAPTKHDTPEAHGAPLGEEEVRRTKEAYGLADRAAVPRARRGTGPSCASASRRGARVGRALAGALRRLERVRAVRPLERRPAELRARRQPDHGDPQGRRRGSAMGGRGPCLTSSAARPISRPRR